MRKPEDYTGDQARSYKRFAQRAKGSRADFENDINFNENPNKFIKSNENKLLLKSIKDQIDYFGYEIEPFHMKNERDVGNFDQGGYFVFDKQKDKEINDSWLDQLDQSNVFQEMQEKAQNENSKKIKKQIKEANKHYEQKMQRMRVDQFFKSSKFESKEEAQAFYKQSDEEVNEEVEDKNQNQKQEEVQEKEQEQKPKLEDLEVEQLKEILYELLEPEETPTSAMKRVRNNLAIKEKKTFKKNVRKSAKETQNATDIQKENSEEAKQTLDLLVDLCTIIVEKTNDPSIYGIKKEELAPIKKVQNLEDDIF